MDSKKNQQMGCGKSWSEKNFVSKCKDRKLRYFGDVTKHKCLEKEQPYQEMGRVEDQRQRG